MVVSSRRTPSPYPWASTPSPTLPPTLAPIHTPTHAPYTPRIHLGGALLCI